MIILLYNPPTTDDTFTWTRPMPLNLLSISSLLDESKYEIIISQEMPEIAFQDFSSKIDNTICVGISSMTGTQISMGIELAKLIKNENLKIPIVWGGYHPTARPSETLESQFVDIVVRGYGEMTFFELVDAFTHKQEIGEILGISYKKSENIIHNPDRPAPDISQLPPMPYHLFNVEKFFEDTNDRTLHYISSRGCPHNCGFCADVVIYKRRWNSLSVEKIVEDLENLQNKYKFTKVRFYDSNLFVNEKRIRVLCEEIIKRKIKFKWVKCNGDVFILDKYKPETFQLMYEAGISNILLGMETGYEKALKLIDKKANLTQNLEVAKRLHEYGISSGFSFMFGFPYKLSSKKEFEIEHKIELVETMKLISELSKFYIPGDYYLLFIYTPFPDVKLFSRYLELGYSAPASLEEWGHVNLNNPKSNTWLSTNSVELYNNCKVFNWFLKRPLERNINVRIGRKLDKIIRNKLAKRIYKSNLRLPLLLKLLQLLVFIISGVKTHGFFSYIKRVIRKIINGK